MRPDTFLLIGGMNAIDQLRMRSCIARFESEYSGQSGRRLKALKAHVPIEGSYGRGLDGQLMTNLTLLGPAPRQHFYGNLLRKDHDPRNGPIRFADGLANG